LQEVGDSVGHCQRNLSSGTGQQTGEVSADKLGQSKGTQTGHLQTGCKWHQAFSEPSRHMNGEKTDAKEGRK